MGCDVHSIGQVKINNQWETRVVDIADSPRDYNSFAIMATVRGRSTWSIPPRGLPIDISSKLDINAEFHVPVHTILDKDGIYWLGDHSHSYLTLKELTSIFSMSSSKLFKIFNKRNSELTNAKSGYLGDVVKSLKHLKREYKVKDDEVRIVFGFDS